MWNVPLIVPEHTIQRDKLNGEILLPTTAVSRNVECPLFPLLVRMSRFPFPET